VIRRRRLGLLIGVVLVVAALASLLGGGELPARPLPGIGRPARAGDPFAYVPAREADFVSRATAGSAGVLFQKSPGGALATAARVAGYRRQIDAAASGSGIDPNLLEAIVFLESAGRPNVIAGSDPAAAAGLTQILAQTGQSLLGMRIDLTASRRLTAAIVAAYAAGQGQRIASLQAQRARIDSRFAPSSALAATIRYLRIAEGRLGGREDLAIVSYHMGIGNLQSVLIAYDGGAPAPYARVYFDTALDRHPAAYKLLSGFGDDSSLYYWRVLGAVQIMRMYRTDRAALQRLARLQTAVASNAEVLHPPDQTPMFADPSGLASAYLSHAIVPLPSNAAELGLRYDPAMGSLARQAATPAWLYRGLRPAALDLLIELAARVDALSGAKAPLTIASTVVDGRYQGLAGLSNPGATTGYSFQLERRYASPAQAAAVQAMLDRLQSLNLIAWAREPAVIDVTVASDASRVIVGGP
jgi:hypothetical protein